MYENIFRVGESSLRLNDGHSDAPVVYIDPVRLSASSPKADLVLVSSDHPAYCSPVDIERVSETGTMVLAPAHAASLIGPPCKIIREYQGDILGGLSVRAVPAYLPHRSAQSGIYESLGYVISFGKYDLYYAGRTGLIPEMERIYCDIAVLPLDPDLMTLEEAREAVRRLKPRKTIPIGYAAYNVATRNLGRRFCDLVAGGTEAVELEITQ